MAEVSGSNFGLQYAFETGGVPSTTWKKLAPTAVSTYGGELATETVTPLSPLGQRREGVVVGRAVAVEFEAAATMDAFDDFIRSYFYAEATNQDLLFRGASATATGYTVPALDASQGARLQFSAGGPISLVHAAGYVDAANNSPQSVKELAADAAASDTEIQVAGLVTETAPTNAEVTLAGIRATAGDLALAVAGNIGTLSSGNNAVTGPAQIDFTTLGLTVGQVLHVGGLTSANRFGQTAGIANGSFGSARIRVIEADSLTLDKLDKDLLASDGTDTGAAGVLVATDLLFGRFVRKVLSSDAAYTIFKHQFEAFYPNLYETDPPGAVNPDGFEYIPSCQANQLEWAMPSEALTTLTLGFVGLTVEDLVDNGDRKAGAATSLDILRGAPLSTSNQFFRIGVAETDDTGLLNFFTDLSFTLANNVTPLAVHGCGPGAKFINTGTHALDVTGSAVFTDPNIVDRINSYTTVTAAFGMRNADGAFYYDIPSCKPGDGSKQIELDQLIQITVSLEAFADPFFGTSGSVSLWPVYPEDGGTFC